mmetsp:Transcript_28743/g.54278  ORF Transcript_28743/g.54278 Transcript_28743/m.54278 type:complete len:645 (-) Transcript_28743:494-2428(-)
MRICGMIATVGMLLALSLQQVTGTLQESMYLRNADDTTNTVMGKSMVTAALMNAGTLSGEGSSQQPASTEMQEVEAVVPAEEPVTAGVNAADPALTNLLVPPLAPPLNVDDECDEDKLKCVSGVCMCLTPGRLVGFLPGNESPQPRDLAMSRAASKFVQLFMPTLPGTDSTEIRRLWEFITGLASESMTMREDGSVRNQRTGAYARPCGDPSSRHVDPLPPTGECQQVKQATEDAPTLITMLEDMTRPGHHKLVEQKMFDASLQVYVVRNPLDQFAAYIKELDELTPTMPMLMNEALANEGLLAQVAGIERFTPPGAAYQPPGADFITALGLQQGHEAMVREEKQRTHASGVTGRKLLGKHGSPREVADFYDNQAIIEAQKADRRGPTMDALWPQRDFQSWFAYQWLPYARNITAPQYAHKQKFVIKYEELMEDPAGIFWDFLLSTGVAQKLGISRRILHALEKKSDRKHDKKLVDLEKTGTGFDGLTKKYGDPLQVDSTAVTALYMPANAETMAMFGYHFWQAEATLQDNLQTLEKEEKEARLAASHLGEEVGGQVKENKMLYKKLSTEEKPESYFGTIFVVLLMIMVCGMAAFSVMHTDKQDKEPNQDGEDEEEDESDRNIYMQNFWHTIQKLKDQIQGVRI